MDDAVRVVGAGDTVQAAYDAGHDCIRVTPEYDPERERYPIDLAITSGRTLHLRGAGPSGTVLGDPDLRGDPVLCVTGCGAGQYGRAPTFSGFSLVGGSAGLRVRAAPQASFADLYATTNGDGFHVADGEGDGGTYGTTWRNCQAWNCAAAGFSFERGADPHNATLFGCTAVANGGIGYRFRGVNWALYGGSAQLNHGYGVEVRGGLSGRLDNVYVEGNARGEEFPLELYAKNHHGALVQGCYFHGVNPRTTAHDHARVQRALNVHDSRVWSVRSNTFRRYGDVATKWFDCEDVSLGSNLTIDADPGR